MTGNNLPPSVSISDPDAPWNQDYPEPDWQCTECERYGQHREMKRGPDPKCPDCGEPVESY